MLLSYITHFQQLSATQLPAQLSTSRKRKTMNDASPPIPQPESLRNQAILHPPSSPPKSSPQPKSALKLYQEVKVPDCTHRHYITASRLNPETQTWEHQTICRKIGKEGKEDGGDWIVETGFTSVNELPDEQRNTHMRLVCSLRAQKAFRRKRARDEAEKRRVRLLEEESRKCGHEECAWEMLEVSNLSYW